MFFLFVPPSIVSPMVEDAERKMAKLVWLVVNRDGVMVSLSQVGQPFAAIRVQRVPRQTGYGGDQLL